MKTRLSLFLLIATIFNVAFSQSLYTKIGTDKPWKDIIRDGDIPIGVNSTAGITGSRIDVRNNLVEGGLYESYEIEQNIAIHTVGNGTVNRNDFPKWSRWYQEDGKTQIFRLHKDEYNTRNDREGAPRIEAESKLLWQESDNEWHEWVTRITVIKAQKVNLFQIFADPEGPRGSTGLMMIGLRANGDIYWNKRDGKTFRTIASNMEGKSVDIKVRDNGLRYELFVNGALFETHNTLKRASRSHFRWGMYSHENMTGEAMVFFSHTQIDGEEIIDNPAIGPEGYTYKTEESNTISISNVPLDIAYGQDGDYVFLKNQTSDVECSNAQFGSDPKPSVKKYCFIKESKMPYGVLPHIIPGVIELEEYDFGGQGVSYSDVDDQNKGAGESNFRTENAVDIGSGNGNRVLGWTADGEWVEYTVSVQSSGTYDMRITYASKNGGGVLGIDMDGNKMLSGIEIPITGDWDTYSDFTQRVDLNAGEHVLRFKIEKGGFNLDKVEFSKASITSVLSSSVGASSEVFPNPSKNGVFYLNDAKKWEAYSLQGVLIKSGNGDQVDLSGENGKMFLLHVEGSFFRITR